MTDDEVRVRGPVMDRASRFFGYLAGVCTLAMVVHVTADVAARTFRGAPLGGTLEWTAFVWMPAIVFLALAGALASGEHLRVTMLVEAFSGVPRKVAEVITLALFAATVALIDVGMWQYAISSFRIGEADVGSGVEVAIWPLKFVAAFGLALLALQALVMIVRILRGTDAPVRPVAADAEEAAS